MKTASNDDMDQVERENCINIDVFDESGQTHLYTENEDGVVLAFDFYSMNPDLEDLKEVAHAIATLKKISDKRPRVGELWCIPVAPK